VKAQVIRSSKKHFWLHSENGEEIQASARGNILRSQSIVVGDWVEVKREETDDWAIEKVHERKNEIFRILVRENKKKVTAANIDLLVIVTSVSKPQFKRGLIDRYLVRACQWQIRPIVVFNKMDQFEAAAFDLEFERDRLKELGAECFEISAKQGSEYKPRFLDKGIEELKSELEGKLAIFLGHSGVGKSKTISTLSGGEFELKTQEVGKVGKGSHTTTWSEIVEFEKFSLIDSPGIRSFSLDDIDPRTLISLFPDLEEAAVHCQYRDCEHLENSGGCVFYHNDWSELKQKAMLSRLESYQRFFEEISQTPFWQKKF
jgi:ribosome biogenesis GTPase